MSNFIIIFLCFILGILFKRISKFPRQTAISLNMFIIYVSLPALVLSKFPKLLTTLKLSGDWWVPISMAWIQFLISFLLIVLISKKLKWSKAKTGALILTCGLGNTSFVGFPLLEALLNKHAISIGILADQPGAFLIVSTMGIIVASFYSGESLEFKKIVKRVFIFPPFLSLLFSILWTIAGTPFYDILVEPLEKISLSLVPLALFSVGFQTDFHFKIIKKRLIPLSIGLMIKLILFPIFFYFFYHNFLHIEGEYLIVTVLESAMATQITSAVVATEFNLDSELANLMVGLSIPLSLITVPLFFKILF